MSEIKKWTRPIWSGRSDIVLRDRALVLVPFGHVVRMVYFEGSSDRTDSRPRWVFRLPFTPGLPGRIWSGTFPVGNSTAHGFTARLTEQLTEKIDSELAPVVSIKAFYEMTLTNRPTEAGAGLWALSRNEAYHAVVLAALGKLDRVPALAFQAVSETEAYWSSNLEYWGVKVAKWPNNAGNQRSLALAARQLEMLSELRQLGTLAREGDRDAIATMLHRWEDQRLKAWGIDDLRTPSPFPIELGEGG